MSDIDQFEAMLQRSGFRYERRAKAETDSDTVPDAAECLVTSEVGGNCMAAVYAWFDTTGGFLFFSVWE